MRSNSEVNEKKENKSKKTAKKLKRSQTNKIISEEAQESKNSPNKNTIKNFEKVLITAQENMNKSSKNFLNAKEIKSGNR
jgi:hypothetical protein